MGQSIYYFGTILWVLGVLLIIGNVTGLVPTFPFAGFLMTIVGFLIQMGGNAIVSSRNNAVVNKINRLLADGRYQTAVQLVAEDANKPGANAESVLERAIAHLVENGVRAAAARENLQLILAAYVVQAKEA